jgi:rubrerythrin
MSNEFLEKIEKSHERWTGKEWLREDTLRNFAVYGKAKRIESLDMIDAAVEAADTADLREYSRLTRLKADLEREHQLLVRNGR